MTNTSELNIEVKQAGSKGLGLFALQAFTAGELIRYVDYVREITEEEPLRADLGERADHCSYEDGKVYLVAYPDRHLNHSCDPNVYYSYEANKIATRARRSIAVHEELTADYLINNSGGDSWPCHCGAKRCRGYTGTHFFDLPLDFQKDYLPLLAPWFKKKHKDELEDLKQKLQEPKNYSNK